jgi:hypothetical protein
VKKNLTILPKIVIPRIMPRITAKNTAKTIVSLNTRKKRGKRITHRIIVKQPVAKSFASIINPYLLHSYFHGAYSALYQNAADDGRGTTSVKRYVCIFVHAGHAQY